MANQVEVYQSDDGALQLSVSLKNESVWLTQADMAVLFDKNKRTVSEHIRNIFKDEELIEEAVVRNFRTTASDGKSYTVNHYNLDVIISVGYRVKSKNGVRFRQWATKTLKQHLLKGYTLNQERLAQNATELDNVLQLVKRIAVLPQNSEFGAGLVDIIASYTQTFLWLQQYDEGLLNSPKGELGGALTPLNDAKAAITQLKQNLINKGEATKLFAQERDSGLGAIWGALDQSVFGEPAYPSIESKAAHLLYFVVKNHPFSDGNKRTAAFLFVDFLNRNQLHPRKNLPRR